MFRRTLLAFLPVLAMVFALASAIQAADAVKADAAKANPVKIVPRDALGWGAINHLADGDAKIQKLFAVVGAPKFELMDIIKDKIGAKKGLDEQGALGVIAMPPKDKDATQPVVVGFVAVTDYSVFLENFSPEKKGEKISKVQIAGRDGVMAQLQEFAVIANSEDQETLEQILAAKESMVEEAKSLGPWLAANDASFAVTKAGVKFLVAQGKASLKGQNASLERFGDGAAQVKANLQLSAIVLDAMEKNVTLGGLGLNVDKAGNFRLALRAKIAMGTELAAGLAEVKPNDNNLLAGLPGGDFVSAAGGAMQESCIRSMADMMPTWIKKSHETFGISAEQADKLAKVVADGLKPIRGASYVMKSAEPGEPIISNIFTSIQVTDADQFLATYEKQMEAMKEIFKDAKEGSFKATSIKKIEINGKPALEIEIEMPKLNMPGNPFAGKMQEAMYGPENKRTMYLVKSDEKTVYTSFGASKENLLKAIAEGKEKKSNLQDDVDVAATVAQFSKGAQAIYLISPRGYTIMMQQLITSAIGQNMPGIGISQFPKTPPIGFAVKAAPEEISAEVVLPDAMMKAVAEYAKARTREMQRRFATPPGNESSPLQ